MAEWETPRVCVAVLFPLALREAGWRLRRGTATSKALSSVVKPPNRPIIPRASTFLLRVQAQTVGTEPLESYESFL